LKKFFLLINDVNITMIQSTQIFSGVSAMILRTRLLFNLKRFLIPDGNEQIFFFLVEIKYP